MKMGFKKLFSILLVVSLLAACSGTTTDDATDEGAEEVTSCAYTVEGITDYLNENEDMQAVGNPIAIIPIDHINGPREEHDLYAMVDFKYTQGGAVSFIKYQVTYVSCTCRAANMNFWQTAYIELTLPESKAREDVQIRYLSYDLDSTKHYNAGFWGDSGTVEPIPETDVTYKMIKEQDIAYFQGKDFAYLDTLTEMNDIALEDCQAGEGREDYTLDTFTGASVSTNNIVRMINAIIDYHMTDTYFTE